MHQIDETRTFEDGTSLAEITYPESPLAVCRRLQSGRQSFFLDSGLDAGGLGRWSFLGDDPFAVIRSKGTRIETWIGAGYRLAQGDPFTALSELLSRFQLTQSDGLPPFAGGAVGYFGYDLGEFVEKLPSLRTDEIGAPDLYFGLYDAIIALDHHTRRAWGISTGLPENDPSPRKRRAAERLGELLRKVEADRDDESPVAMTEPDAPLVRSNFTEDGYRRAVLRAKEYIAAGDIFQVNISQRFTAPLQMPPIELYARLRRLNPEPFAAYLRFPELAVASSSPERYLRFSGDYVETRPIKGTRPRGKDAASDSALRQELLSSAKDRAELVMIVDLERNDLGRFCQYGTVRVPELVVCEEHPTVFHLVATVTGKVAPGRDRVDCIKSCFPGGSITGAPKVRSMEIIEELEPTKRGIYTGAIGYLGFNGEVDLNIAIRTFVLKDGLAYFQVGGGIVADSEPDAEYQETLDKARALFQALNVSPERGKP